MSTPLATPATATVDERVTRRVAFGVALFTALAGVLLPSLSIKQAGVKA